jgi:hypothetical protein
MVALAGKTKQAGGRYLKMILAMHLTHYIALRLHRIVSSPRSMPREFENREQFI